MISWARSLKVTADSICRPATRLPRFSVQILRMGCNTRILSPVLQIRSPQAFLPGSLDLLTCLPVGRGCRSRYYSQVPFWRQSSRHMVMKPPETFWLVRPSTWICSLTGGSRSDYFGSRLLAEDLDLDRTPAFGQSVRTERYRSGWLLLGPSKGFQPLAMPMLTMRLSCSAARR
jgi:hypothetical protein